MIHTIDKEPLNEKRYYWRVDASYVKRKQHQEYFFFSNFLYRCLTMFPNETTNKFSREIALEKVILQLNTNQDRPHYFEIRTEQNIYYCGYRRTRNRVREILNNCLYILFCIF